MKKILKFLTVFFAVSMAVFATSCSKKPYNPNEPNVNIDFTIYPNTLEYQELNNPGGWLYVTAPLPSYGIIIYRWTNTEFKAYERLAPNNPYACADNRLIVDGIQVLDTCINYVYSIVDGSIIEGNGYPLIQYKAVYDGQALRVSNFN